MKVSKQFLLFALLLFSASCTGQRISITAHPSNTSRMIKGDTVRQLGNHLMHILQDKKGNYWFGTWGESLYHYDGKTIIRYCLDDGMCDDSIVQMVEDKSGNVYFNARSGLYKYDGKTFTTLHVSEYSKNEWRLSPDDLWFKGAQDSGCVYRYDGKKLHRLTFPKTVAGDTHYKNFPRSQFTNATYSPYDVYIFYTDRKKNLWFGTATLGACRYDGKSFKWISQDELGHGDFGFGIRSITEDKDGKFWFSKSMYRYDFYSDDGLKNSTGWYQKEDGIGNPEEIIEDDFIYFMSSVRDQHGNMWLATYGRGVYKYDGKNLTHYPVRDGDKDITTFTIYRDQNNELWLGTHENGVYKFNGKEFRQYLPLQ